MALESQNVRSSRYAASILVCTGTLLTTGATVALGTIGTTGDNGPLAKLDVASKPRPNATRDAANNLFVLVICVY